MKTSPDVVIIQPKHLQVFEQADTLRNLGQTVVVQQELSQRDKCSREGIPVQAAVAQIIVRQLEGLKARPQVAEGEGGDVMDVVVLEGQFAQTARQVWRYLSELVVGKVHGF